MIYALFTFGDFRGFLFFNHAVEDKGSHKADDGKGQHDEEGVFVTLYSGESVHQSTDQGVHVNIGEEPDHGDHADGGTHQRGGNVALSHRGEVF